MLRLRRLIKEAVSDERFEVPDLNAQFFVFTFLFFKHIILLSKFQWESSSFGSLLMSL